MKQSATHIVVLQPTYKFSSIPCGRQERQLSEFHRLIEQQIPKLRRYARALTRNRDRADDLVQDTLGRPRQGTILAARDQYQGLAIHAYA